MKDLTVTQVSRTYGVSTRMLRYYEKEGLLASKSREGYAYRIYDGAAVTRLRQILLLRKLRFSLKQIGAILNAADQSEMAAVFLRQLSQLDGEIAALKLIREVLVQLADRGREGVPLLEDEALRRAIEALPPPPNTVKEAPTMSELNRANRTLDSRETVRILLLPPYTVASYQYIGENPEDVAGDVVAEWIRTSRIYERKPDARMFGFNHPSPARPGGTYGYEFWVTIPEDLALPEPLVKKRYPGGLYAALTMDFPEFYRWQVLAQWVQDSSQYGENYSSLGDGIMGGCLEEHLNGVYCAHQGVDRNAGLGNQLDLLLPVKKRPS